MSNLILYTTDDGKSQIQLRAEKDTVWLTQLEMAELFNTTKQNISLHLKNIFKDGELAENSVVKESLTTATDPCWKHQPCRDEAKIRQKLLDDGNIDTVIGLPPSLFSSSFPVLPSI